MPAWLIPVLSLVGTILLVGAGIVGSVLTNQAAKRANATAAAVASTAAVSAQKSAENELIDQLQEELKGYRESNDARATEQDKRMRGLEERNIEITNERDILRDYAHELRGHVFDGKPPPPPDWPDGVYR